ncbi:hypothetical protein H7U19_11855 [Hyunsoonleella sp. SJ7]|uniref:Uncharacterized protein n=1 Tax=Hyunsoonleella aquatilis TaxID=2762758 RepID=A0A923HGU5_9FLAO|nr:hypothetical protein [Hyunsoonleella aquatilis]MBC3759105.1 hypothetical protein [Hyunsoonleella aquatilis]
MNSTAQKGLKPFAIKIVAIAMSMCYVFGPSHSEVNKVLHILVHQLEMPENVMSHTSAERTNHAGHTNHKLKNDEAHQHTFLETIQKILKASDTDNDKDEPKIVFQKIDKHIRTNLTYKRQSFFSAQHIRHQFFVKLQHIRNGYPDGKFQPPQFT